ncbi:cation channel sperm-associated protein subunit delta [Cebus imitator]|uniref:cation channel sperm-associated protein subunit delta n=1 Tax=Cebus imitator TaxID=2715852 RepID=UPI001897307F|nr:cation channel sperm-associated protein subunit delta [Cebus imitator]
MRSLRLARFGILRRLPAADRLSFSSTTPRLITHPCKKNIALYLGVPEVTSAHFTSSLLLLVVAQKVYIYDYENDSWNVTFGIKHPVTHVSGDNCCYTETLFCMEIGNLVFAYFRGDQISQTYIYYSNNGGFIFWKYHYDRQAEITGSLGGIFQFFSLSQVGILVVDQGKGMFKYSDHPLNRSLGLSFDYNGTLDILIVPGQRGILLLWFEHSLLFSHNAGQLVDTVRVKKGDQTLFSSMFEASVTIHNIAVNENELAVITREDNLYYGNLGVVPSSVIKVMVSNPYSLGFQATFYESGHTLDGNTKYNLDICLKQQQHWGRTNPNFTSSLKRATISTVTVDIANKEISCVDVKPLSTLISIGCDLDKRIVIQNKISACSKGILDALTLQDNYSFIIEKEFYDPSFQGQPSSQDLHVPYSYSQLGCPLLVYYDTPWKPVVELWRKDTFQEIVDAEYVLLEVNGQFSYRYSLTAQSALCTSQPQNWTTMIKEFGMPFLWNRENYVSCHDSNRNATLRWPDVQYQILGGRTTNQIIFSHNNEGESPAPEKTCGDPAFPTYRPQTRRISSEWLQVEGPG